MGAPSGIWLALMLLQIGHVYTQFDKIIEVNENSEVQKARTVKLMEGDIALEGENTVFDASSARKWTNGVVPYIIRSGQESKLEKVINEAKADYAKYTCIKWVRYKDKAAIANAKISNYIEFFATGAGCYSYVGMTNLKPQVISIRVPGCNYKGIVIHEMLHALGFWHEQSRMDRDTYITVLTQNIQSGKENNFKKHSSNYYGQKYDLGSIMHYGPKAFSKNGQPTILSKEGITNFGQREGLSPIDIKQINSHYECAPGPEPTSPPPPPPPPTPPPSPVPNGDCGIPDVAMADMMNNDGSRVIGGKNANRGSWPWQILLTYLGRQRCGGSIIGEKWVVTAAHCVYGKESPAKYFAVRAGEHDQRVTEGSEQVVIVKKVIPHPKYNATTMENDIALLELSASVKFNKWVKPVCLPTADVEGKPNQYCYITGWGRIDVEQGPHHTLQQGKLEVPSKQECNSTNNGFITDDMICGGDGGKTKLNGCYGDSGGPFVCSVNGKWELHGAVSWGDRKCNSSRWYTVFSKVLSNKDWILSITGLITKPVDGNWGDWDNWSACTESCGGGTQFRTRECNSPRPENGGKYCPGIAKETRSCNTDKCPPGPPVGGDCGKPTFPPKRSSDRVIGGENAIAGSWPWQILLSYNGRPGCGGSLIRKDWVVTAAHCVSWAVNRPNLFSVKVGEHDRTKVEGTEKTYKVKQFIAHPKYNPRTISNDIALLQLTEEVKFNDHVKPVCLPEKDISVGSFCYITGWGKIKHPGNMYTILQQGRLQVPSNLICNNLNQPTSGIKIDDTMICGGDGGDTNLSGCHGDSGGPFVCKVNGRWELHGAVSWGSSRCNSSLAYTVFSRITKNLAWIKGYAGVIKPPIGPTTPFPGVNCGGHRAPSCQKCTDGPGGGQGALWCNGECSWCKANNQCQAKGEKCGDVVPTKPPPPGPDCPMKDTIFAYRSVGRTSKVNTWQECAAICAADKICFGWSWANGVSKPNGARLKCKMKNKKFMDGKKKKLNYVSGAKSCTGGPKPVTTKPPVKTTTRRPTTKPPVKTTTRRPPSNNQCGVQAHRTQVGKIVGGKNAEEGEFPWMVGLYSRDTAKPGIAPFCGGTLIRDNVVMTAAHCLSSRPNPDKYAVRIGDHNLLKGKIGPKEQAVNVSKIYRHENYKRNPPQNDIALLILDKKVKLGGQVQVACLPSTPVDVDATCYASGWGTLKEGGNRQPAVLQEVELPLMTNEKCKEGNGNDITNDMICAGFDEGGKDACQGDSGGPLVCRIPGTDRMEVRGITSWGYGCAREDKPGVYARVHYFVKNNWINSKLMKHRIEEISKKIKNIESTIKTIKDKNQIPA